MAGGRQENRGARIHEEREKAGETLENPAGRMKLERMSFSQQQRELDHRAQEQMEDPESPLRRFMDGAVRGEFPREAIDRFVHGGNVRFGPPEDGEDMNRVMFRYAERLGEDIRRAWGEELQRVDWTREGRDGNDLRERADRAMRENAVLHVLAASPHHPPRELGHPETHINGVWERRWRDDLEKWKRRLEGIHFVLKQQDQEATTYQKTGELPGWLDPEVFTKETLTVDPELEKLGYSPMHNTPIDPLAPTHEIERYLKRQMDVHVAGNGKTNLGEHPADFGRALLGPALDPDLSAGRERFDAPNWSYVDDGPINYEEHLRVEFVVAGDPKDPVNHFQASYGRMVRDALMEKGVADDAYMDRPDLLAMSYPRNVLALERMAEFAHAQLEKISDGEWRRPELQDYDPVVRWDMEPEENLEALRAWTGDMEKLKERVNEAARTVHSEFDPGDLTNHDSVMLNYSFIARPEDPGSRDVDHPSAVLLREAATDFSRAVELTDWYRYDETKAEARKELLSGKDEEEVMKMLEERGVCPEVRYSIQDALESDMEVRRVQLALEGETGEDIRSATMTGWRLRHQEEKWEDDPAENMQERTLLETLDRLAHADFCITMAKLARG